MSLDKYVLYGGPQRENLSEGTKSFGEFLIKRLSENGNKVALVNAVTSKEITYSELLEKSIQLAEAFKSSGLKKNDIIGICSENCFEFPIVIFAAWYIGAIVVPFNISYTEHELLHSLNLSHPKFILTSLTTIERIQKIAQKVTFIKTIVLFGNNPISNMQGITLLPDFINKFKINQTKQFQPDPINFKEQIAIILSSSGTTGQPKGVQLSQLNLLSSTVSFEDRLKTPNSLDNKMPIVLGIAPWFHSFGVSLLIGCCTAGAKLVFLQKFEEKLFLSAIEKNKVTNLYMVPPIMVFMAKSPLIDNYNLTSLQIISCGAASLSQEIEEKIQSRFNNQNIKIQQAYGLTESTLSVTRQRTEQRKPGCVGSVCKGMWVKIIDIETGKSLGPNKTGEILVKGPKIMIGYIGDDEATRGTIDEDGWLHTGDIGYYDDDFQFFIVGRIKELIKYKGFQVPPAEIEALLLTHPKILDAAVIGKPDEECGELPTGFIVKKPGVELTEDEVKSFVKKTLSGPKHLRGGVYFIDAIPKNPSGKILRRILKELPYIKSKL